MSKALAYVAHAISNEAPEGRNSSMARPKLAASLLRMPAAIASAVARARPMRSASARAGHDLKTHASGVNRCYSIIGNLPEDAVAVIMRALPTVDFDRDVAASHLLDLARLCLFRGAECWQNVGTSRKINYKYAQASYDQFFMQYTALVTQPAEALQSPKICRTASSTDTVL
jgi:hypothetical protein